MCEHCLSPGTDSGEGIGADNMTVLIIALLHDKSPKEWAQWITRRVEKGYGYKTPLEPARIWAESRIQEGRRKRELYSQREMYMKARGAASDAADEAGKRRTGNEDLYARMHSGPPLWDMSARILGSNGGISFRPGALAASDLHNLMFDNDDNDDDMNVDNHETKDGKPAAGKHADGMDEGSDEEVFDDVSDWNSDNSNSAFLSGYPLGASDATKGLREQLEELEKDDDARAQTPTQGRQGEAPPPPPPSASAETAPPESQIPPPSLSGDAPSDAVKAEGLMDKSEDPLLKA